MFSLIIFILVIGFLIYSVLSLDFEMGTGFTEMKKNIREVEYREVDEEGEDEDKKYLK